MELTWIHYLIVCPLVGLAGFVDAVGGGGGLVSLPAYLIAGLPTHFAIATNKISSAMGTSLATYRYAKKGFMGLKRSVFGAVFALAGAATGAKLALMVDDSIFRIIMLVIIPLTAVYVLRTKTLDVQREPLSPAGTYIAIAATAFFVGIYDGFYGPGTGTFMILLLTAVAHIDLREANGLSKVFNLTTNLSSLAVYLINGKALIALGLAAGCCNLIGSYIGTEMFTSKGTKIVKPIMITVLTIFFIKTLIEVFGS